MHDKSTAKYKPTRIFVLLVCINVILISFNQTQRVQTLRNFIRYLFYPTPRLALNIIDHGQYLTENMIALVRMREENRSLKEYVNHLSYLEKKYAVAAEENERLKKILDIKKDTGYQLVSARVTSHDSINYFRSVTIDKGENHGILADLAVIAFVGPMEALVGRIASVDNTSAKVLLITDDLSSVPARIVRSGEDGMVQGVNKPNLVFDFLFPDSTIKIGDDIITSGMGDVFPSGIFIGSVQEIHSTERGYFKQAVVKPNVLLNKLSEVFIIRKEAR